jgi:TolB-like protein
VVWQRQRPADTRPTIAVLAFDTNMIGGDETTPRYLTEAITTELTRLGTMNVASYSSAMRLQGQRLSSKEQSAALNSTYLIEGSIDDEGGLILVVPRIVNGVAERKLWVSDYRGDYSEVRSIAQRIAFDINAEISRIARTP